MTSAEPLLLALLLLSPALLGQAPPGKGEKAQRKGAAGAEKSAAGRGAAAGKTEPAPAARPYQWWRRSYAGRRAVTFEKEPPRGAVALLAFGTAGLIRPDAHDLRLIADHEVQLPMEVLEVGPGDRAVVQFETPEPGHLLHLYLGSAAADPPRRPGHELRAGLRMELFALPPGSADSWAEVQKLLKAAGGPPLGVLFPETIDLGLPPLGRSGDCLARYTGYLQVEKGGEHLFETASEGASFARVDGKPVCEWPGFHDLSGHSDPRKRKEHSGAVNLAPGVHHLEYLVAAPRGGVHVLGLRGPGDPFSRPIPAQRFLPWVRARAGPLEAYQEAAADFVVRPLSDSGSDAERHELAELEFEWWGDLAGRELSAVEWDFGDGQRAEGRLVRHVYLGHGLFTVTAAARAGAGKILSAARRVAVRFESLRVQDLNRLLEGYYRSAKDYDLAKLSEDHLARLSWLSSKDYAWEETLFRAVEVYFERGFSLRRDGMTAEGLRRARKLVEKREGYDRAEKILERALREAPRLEDRQEAEVWRARSRMLRADPGREEAEAEQVLRRVHRESGSADPGRRAAIFLADLLLRKGSLGEAEKLLETVEEGPYRRFEGERQVASGAHALSFDNHLRRGELREAEEELWRWEWELPRDRLWGHLQLCRAALHRREKRYDEALRELEQVQALAPAQNQIPRALLLAAEILAERGDRQEARARLERVARDYPRRPESKEAERRLQEQ